MDKGEVGRALTLEDLQRAKALLEAIDPDPVVRIHAGSNRLEGLMRAAPPFERLSWRWGHLPPSFAGIPVFPLDSDPDGLWFEYRSGRRKRSGRGPGWLHVGNDLAAGQDQGGEE